ncbi:fumarylacetoacetate hydrolase family protein [Pseudonocardia sp. NPDC046786]|uniref:fumarylacetoacetate hydrolase family protein n=1 Tax=Pseudonocardia sp. NPDC046786 TaxID=3155471 RepID=UPI0033DD28C9
MKLARVGPRGAERPVLVADDALLDLTGITPDIDPDFLSGNGIDAVSEALRAGLLPALPGAADRRWGAPVARPGAIVCIGMNYAAHAAESGAEPPEHPVVFFKSPSALAGPDDDVPIPPGATKLDWEVELGIVIGRRAHLLDSPADSMAHVAGFVLADDLSERALQLEVSGGQWGKGKSAPGFGPLGPWLVTPDEIDHRDLRLCSRVNGEPRQDSSTKDMVFGVEYLVHDLSRYLALEPGDVVLTGTPEGVALSGRHPYLAPGDVVEVEIDGLGTARHTIVGGVA